LLPYDFGLPDLVKGQAGDLKIIQGSVFMKFGLAAALAAVVLLLAGGCATPPQPPIPLSDSTLKSPGARIGVAMSPLPKVDTHLLGASCLLCYAAASVANSSLTSHAGTLPLEDLPKLKADAAAALRKKGLEVVVIDEDVKIEDLPAFSSQQPNTARKNFSSLRDKYKLDKLLVIDITTLGFQRTYSAYIPTGDPKGIVRGSGYIVNLQTHALEWYVPVEILKSAEGKWDEPPKFPGLSNAYFQALELGRDSFVKPLGQ
jgi:hypothetical protein